MRTSTLLVLCLCASPASAQQPYSDSLADCAGLMWAGTELSESDDLIRQLQVLAGRFESAAYVQAQTEGRTNPQAVIGARIEGTRDGWRAKGRMMVFSEEFKEWTAYCRSFGQHMGLELTP